MLPQNLRVNLLSRTQLFHLCDHVSVAPLRYEARLCAPAVRQCFAAPQNFERIVGLRLGLLGLYWGAVLNATGNPHGAYDRSTGGSPTINMPRCRRILRNLTIPNADGMAAAFAEDGIRERPTATWILRRYHCSRRRPSDDHGRNRDDCRAWTVMT